MDILCDESLKISILPSLKVISQERVNNDANFLEGYKLAPHHMNVHVCLGSFISSSPFNMSISILVSPQPFLSRYPTLRDETKTTAPVSILAILLILRRSFQQC